MKNTSRLLLITTLILTTACYGECNLPADNETHDPIKTPDDNYIIFKKTELPNTVNAQNDYQITLGVYNCTTNIFEEIDKLQFLASPGEIAAAFFAEAEPENKDRLFIIQRFEVSNSATGVNYTGHYYDVRAYKKGASRFEVDNASTNFFGAGGDIYEGDRENIIYKFPYKEESSIRRIISTPDYAALILGKTLEKHMARKAYMYSEPLESSKTKKYLIPNDPVHLYSHISGWCLVGYDNRKYGEIKAWISCESISDLFNP
ncbi:hypothetical protein [Pseudomonas indica]|uniref:hypothetical protein n=1 Tax=Pseudomonas indica TaxID=137658 RepID=UPI0023F9E309|nr:hypothetical protein [Pseudomonas indica]MBU3057790.1 hypothetical protein [Pseudomonas indica]